MGMLTRIRKWAANNGSNPPAPITQALTAQGMTADRPFGPGTPLNPWDGFSRPPRVYDYRIGHNITARPRTETGRPSFDTLKAIIDSYDVAKIVINHRVDDLRSMEWHLEVAPRVQGDATAAIDAGEAAMQYPDRELPFGSWIAKYLQDLFRYDAATLYRRRNEAGDVIGLEVVDGKTISPLVDYNGRRPHPPAPAFQQFIQGQPWEDFTSQDLIYVPFWPVADSVYGCPPVEAMLLSANTDLRWQWHFLNYFTEGSIPAGFAEAPPDRDNPDQVAEWQAWWDAVMEGDQTQKVKIRWVPAGTKWTAAKAETFDPTFPTFLLRKFCAAYSVVPSDLGFVEDVNRANGETQVDTQFRVATLPLVRHLEGILTRYLQKDLCLPLLFRFDTGQEKEDRLAEAQAWKIATEGGAVSVDEWREQVYGLPIDSDRPVPRFVFSPRTGPVPLTSVLGIAGPTDPETGAPVDDVPLPTAPFDGARGLLPDKSPGGTQFKRAPIDPDEPQFPALEKPVPGSDVVGTLPGKPTIGEPGAVVKEATAGVTAATGITGVDQVKDDDESAEADADSVTKEAAVFTRFVKARQKAGAWRDFQFEHVSPLYAHRMNDLGRSIVRKAAGEIVAAGLAVQAADTGRVLMLQRALDPADPASGTWEFPGGHVETGEEPLAAAIREWCEETGCTPPFGQQGAVWTSSNGIYRGYVWHVATEAAVPIHDGRDEVTNPDDPDGDRVEALAWWDPALIAGNPAVRAELAVDLPIVLPALGVQPVAKAGGAGPKGSWRDADHLPSHKFDLRLTDHYAPLVQQAIRALFGDQHLRAAIEAARSVVAKSVADDTPPARAAAKQALAGQANLDALKTAVQQIWGDSYLAGAHVAATLTGGTVAGALDEVSSQVDWDTWKPGWAAAANKLADGGLADLLAQSDVTIKGVADSVLDQIGNTIGDGVARGLPVDTIADSLDAIFDDPSRSEMVANTETNRAMSLASMDTYQANGVEQVTWLVADPCDICAPNADVTLAWGESFPSGDTEPPAHPRCRCAISPA